MDFLSPNPGIGNWVQSQDPSGAWSWVNMETIMTGRQPSIVSRWRQVGGWVREQIGCLRPLHHCYLELFTSTTLLPTWYTRTMAKGVDSFAWWTPNAKGLKWDHVETLMMWFQPNSSWRFNSTAFPFLSIVNHSRECWICLPELGLNATT